MRFRWKPQAWGMKARERERETAPEDDQQHPVDNQSQELEEEELLREGPRGVQKEEGQR